MTLDDFNIKTSQDRMNAIKIIQFYEMGQVQDYFFREELGEYADTKLLIERWAGGWAMVRHYAFDFSGNGLDKQFTVNFPELTDRQNEFLQRYARVCKYFGEQGYFGWGAIPSSYDPFMSHTPEAV